MTKQKEISIAFKFCLFVNYLVDFYRDFWWIYCCSLIFFIGKFSTRLLQYRLCNWTSNLFSYQTINCASPFCPRQFHLHCAGLKSKKVNNIYFLCKSCNDFITYSNSSLQNKLTVLEKEL